MKTDLHSCAQKIARAATQPRLHRELHFECGLYKSDHDRTPCAALQLDHVATTPLIKLIAVMAGMALSLWLICGMMRWCRRIFCHHPKITGCDCY